MSANESHAHDSAIKTPGQLLTVVVLSFVVPIFIIVLLVQFVTGSKRYEKGSSEMTPEAVADRIKPVAGITLGEAGSGGGALKTGEEIYKTVCTACHATGVSKAPRFGNTADWAPRIAQGVKTLLGVAIKGKGAMPPRGGTSLSDLEIERAVVYMANAGGAKFKEPVVAPAAGGKAPK